MRLSTLLLLAACGTSGSDTSDTADTEAPATDADGDGSPAEEDCDDADAAVHPGADDPCDGADQDCDGADGDPDAPQALLVRDGEAEDVSERLATGVNLDISRAATLYVCGGTWDPWLLVDADLAVYASDAELLGAVVDVDDADVTLEGGTWAGSFTFTGNGAAAVRDLELGVASLSAREGYSLTVVGVELGDGKVTAGTGGHLQLDGVTIGGTEPLVVNGSEGGTVTLTDVVVTNTSDSAILKTDRADLTIDGLVMAGVPGSLSVIGGTATLSGLDISGGSVPLYLASSTVTIRDSVFTANEAVMSNSGTLTVEDTAFVGTHHGTSIGSSGSLTVRRTSFTGTTTEGNLSPYEVSFDVESLDRELLLEECTFADSLGGGTAIFTNGPTRVVDTTFSNMGSSNVAIVGAYLNTPFLSDELDGRVVFERVTVANGSAAAFEGTLCPTLVDTVVSSPDAEVARFRSWDEERMRCAQFGDGLEVTSGDGVVFETPVDFGCADCTFTGFAGNAVLSAPSGSVTLDGGAVTDSSVTAAAISLESGTVTLTGVDLGTGASENAGYDGSRRDDVLIGAMDWDGAGVVSVTCDADGCR